LRRILPTDDEDDDAAANDAANHRDQPATVARFSESSLRLEEPFLRPNPPFLRPNPDLRHVRHRFWMTRNANARPTPSPGSPQHVKMPVSSSAELIVAAQRRHRACAATSAARLCPCPSHRQQTRRPHRPRRHPTEPEPAMACPDGCPDPDQTLCDNITHAAHAALNVDRQELRRPSLGAQRHRGECPPGARISTWRHPCKPKEPTPFDSSRSVTPRRPRSDVPAHLLHRPSTAPRPPASPPPSLFQ
jgi:hypothetical protein